MVLLAVAYKPQPLPTSHAPVVFPLIQLWFRPVNPKGR